MTTKKNLPNVWNYSKKISDIPEGAMCINTNEPDKLKIFQDEKWTDTDPFEDLEERKVKK